MPGRAWARRAARVWTTRTVVGWLDGSGTRPLLNHSIPSGPQQDGGGKSENLFKTSLYHLPLLLRERSCLTAAKKSRDYLTTPAHRSLCSGPAVGRRGTSRPAAPRGRSCRASEPDAPAPVSRPAC